MAARTAGFVRSGVVQVSAPCIDRRERRPLRESAEAEHESGDNRGVAGLARACQALGWRTDPGCRRRSTPTVHRRGGRSPVQARTVRGNALARYELFRAVGIRDEDADDYHLYITNLPREVFLPADIATLYRCRWVVETLFRELKTQYELDEFDTSDPDVVKILLYAALLSLLVSRELLDLVTEQADDEIVFPPERWAATFRSHAQLILHELGEYLGYSPPPLLERLIEDAQKIHSHRPILQETLANATQPRGGA